MRGRPPQTPPAYRHNSRNVFKNRTNLSWQTSPKHLKGVFRTRVRGSISTIILPYIPKNID
jgi:hypothetical protein